MDYVLIIAVAALTIGFVAYPMMTKKKYFYYMEDMFELGDVKQLNYLNAKKAGVLENIRELDFEHEMGKLSEEDYSRLRQGYLLEAQDIVKSIDKLKVKEEIEDLIEHEVRSRRRIQ